MDYYFEGVKRLDWGFGNPNTTAALIAICLVTTFGIAISYYKKTNVYWIFFVLTVWLSVYLIETISRGGMLAAILGILTVLFTVRPKITFIQLVVILLTLISLYCYSFSIGIEDRFTQGLVEEDRSVSNRWLIYRSIPDMLIASPSGWGDRQAAEAYQQWYQPSGKTEKYLNLVSSHFTWMVEWGTIRRLCYSTGWFLILTVSYPIKGKRWWSITFASCITLFVAALFSPVASNLYVWVIPIVSFSLVVLYRILNKVKMTKWFVIVGLFGGGVIYLIILSFSWLTLPNTPKISLSRGIVTVGSTKAKKNILIVGSNKKILGETIGHRIRLFVVNNGDVSVSLATSLPSNLKSFNKIILVGSEITNISNIDSGIPIFLLNPIFPATDMNPFVKRKITVLWGEMYSDDALYGWKYYAVNYPNIKFKRMLGEGKYLEKWLDYIQ